MSHLPGVQGVAPHHVLGLGFFTELFRISQLWSMEPNSVIFWPGPKPFDANTDIHHVLRMQKTRPFDLHLVLHTRWPKDHLVSGKKKYSSGLEPGLAT